MSSVLTAKVKTFAFDLGSDLVGIGNIERWKNCPDLMSPKGIMPSAKSVIVCGLHHTDSMVEIGGEGSPHFMGTYDLQILMNCYLDYMSFQMSRFLEDLGYQAIPITASNIWRYREYKNLKSVFSPDMSHIYAAVAAGLAEMGYSGLALTPEYGPRNRFVSIITDAPLDPTPLLPGNTLCDHCKMCVKFCENCGGALGHEIKGMTALEIEGHRYEFADKNLWRCSWAEHFGLNAELPKPEKVDETAILENMEKYGRRCGTIGSCLKYCLPKHLRSWNRDYSSAPIRKKFNTGHDSAVLRSVEENLISHMLADGIDAVIIDDVTGWKALQVDAVKFLPDAKSLIALVIRDIRPKNDGMGKAYDLIGPADFLMQKTIYFVAKKLEELGYNAAPYNEWNPSPEIRAHLENKLGKAPMAFGWIATSATLTARTEIAQTSEVMPPKDLTDYLKNFSLHAGADLAGIASANRIDQLADQLRPVFDGETVLDAHDANPLFISYKPEITERIKKIFTAKDYLPRAKSVLVLGVRLPRAAVNRTAAPPAEAVGPYVFVQYESQRMLELASLRVVRDLQRLGYKAIPVKDLMGTASTVGTPRGEEPDIFCSRFAAVAAGLGTLGKGGFVITPKFGPNMRFMAIVTDADLREDTLNLSASLRSPCDAGCTACIDRCKVHAYRKPVEFTLEGQKISFTPVDQKHCDWAKRYALVGDEGFKFNGSKLNIFPPEKITAEALSQALEQHDPITKFRPCSAEMCAVACPLAK
jgi:epoxyqueuosine reductase QueG